MENFDPDLIVSVLEFLPRTQLTRLQTTCRLVHQLVEHHFRTTPYALFYSLSFVGVGTDGDRELSLLPLSRTERCPAEQSPRPYVPNRRHIELLLRHQRDIPAFIRQKCMREKYNTLLMYHNESPSVAADFLRKVQHCWRGQSVMLHACDRFLLQAGDAWLREFCSQCLHLHIALDVRTALNEGKDIVLMREVLAACDLLSLSGGDERQLGVEILAEWLLLPPPNWRQSMKGRELLLVHYDREYYRQLINRIREHAPCSNSLHAVNHIFAGGEPLLRYEERQAELVIGRFVAVLLGDDAVAGWGEIRGSLWYPVVMNHVSGEILELRAEINGSMQLNMRRRRHHENESE